jgi:hypothetical protein
VSIFERLEEKIGQTLTDLLGCSVVVAILCGGGFAFSAARNVIWAAEIAKTNEPGALRTPDLVCQARDKNGVLVRSVARRNTFRRLTGYPNGRPGYVVDHIIPLTCGGCDVPSNMEWLKEADWKRKSLWERQPCSAWFDGTNVLSMRRQK